MKYGIRSDLVGLKPGCPPVRSCLEPLPRHLEEDELGLVTCMEQYNLKLSNQLRWFY